MQHISRKFPGYLIIVLWKRFLDIRVYPRGYLGQGQVAGRVSSAGVKMMMSGIVKTSSSWVGVW